MIKSRLTRTLDFVRGRRIHQRLCELVDLQFVPYEKSKNVQDLKLSALLLHAYKHVPYYRDVLQQQEIVDSRNYVHLDRFQHMPVLTKEILMTQWHQLKSDDLDKRRWRKNFSGGSTGEPVQYLQDHTFHDARSAVKDLFDIWSGCPLGHKKALLWGSERDLMIGGITLWVKSARWLRNHVWLNAFRMTTESMEAYVDKINEFKPDQILAYVQSAYEMAQFIKLKNLHVHSPKCVMTSAGTLYPHIRTFIEGVFGAPVFNRYGSREMGDVACECPQHDGLHVVPFTHLVEILRPDGSAAAPNEEGEIFITLLTNFAMPLIRYKIGDRGIWSDRKCPCGQSWPLLKQVSGRISDAFKRRDGGVVSPEYFLYLIGDAFNQGKVKQYQVIQENYDTVRIKLVFFPQINQEELLTSSYFKEIEEKIKLIMGGRCIVLFESVDEIPPTASGKLRFVYSLIE